MARGRNDRSEKIRSFREFRVFMLSAGPGCQSGLDRFLPVKFFW